jgi:hypothetical protein
MWQRPLSAVALVGLALACSAAPGEARQHLCSRGVESLREALASEPRALAARVAGSGDYRYLEWFGIGSVVPGIGDQECVRKGGFLRWFEGTSDAVCSEQHAALYERSYAFAEQYNVAMASLRESKGLAACNAR